MTFNLIMPKGSLTEGKVMTDADKWAHLGGVAAAACEGHSDQAVHKAANTEPQRKMSRNLVRSKHSKWIHRLIYLAILFDMSIGLSLSLVEG